MLIKNPEQFPGFFYLCRQTFLSPVSHLHPPQRLATATSTDIVDGYLLSFIKNHFWFS